MTVLRHGVLLMIMICAGLAGCGYEEAVPFEGSDSDTGDSETLRDSDAAYPAFPPITEPCPTFETGIAAAGGLDDIYIQAGPKGDGNGALLFYWHGTASSADEVNTRLPAAVRDEILQDGGIIIAFDGSLGTGDNCSGTGIFRSDDFEVADLLAACAVRDYNINPRRIYTTGCSAGGLQSGCMGIRRSAYIAATVPNSGGIIVKETVSTPGGNP